jgi:hypothetical protein
MFIALASKVESPALPIEGERVLELHPEGSPKQLDEGVLVVDVVGSRNRARLDGLDRALVEYFHQRRAFGAAEGMESTVANDPIEGSVFVELGESDPKSNPLGQARPAFLEALPLGP